MRQWWRAGCSAANRSSSLQQLTEDPRIFCVERRRWTAAERATSHGDREELPGSRCVERGDESGGTHVSTDGGVSDMERYRLISQMRRSAVSIPSNIAE